MNTVAAPQGLVVDGGGEMKGIVGIVVGMAGIDGIVVGMVGREAAGSGGSASVGTEGKFGNFGFGKDEIWVLGKGGSVGFGRVGAVGRLGNGVVGNGGSVAVGSVGAAGTEACKRLRAAKLTWMLESDNAIIRDSNSE